MGRMEALDTAVTAAFTPAEQVPAVTSSLVVIAAEIASALTRIEQDAATEISATADLVLDARRIFVLGAGRSGLALRMTAMRLMHLGLEVHVVGDVTAPAIDADDLLLTASGSGTTGGIVRAAETAIAAGARIAAITTAPDSRLSVRRDARRGGG